MVDRSDRADRQFHARKPARRSEAGQMRGLLRFQYRDARNARNTKVPASQITRNLGTPHRFPFSGPPPLPPPIFLGPPAEGVSPQLD